MEFKKQKMYAEVVQQSPEGAQSSSENLGAKPITEDVELNEDQLEVVAGGAKFGLIDVGYFPIKFPSDPTPIFPDRGQILY